MSTSTRRLTSETASVLNAPRSAAIITAFLALACSPERVATEPRSPALHALAVPRCIEVATELSGALVPVTAASSSASALVLTTAPITLAGITGTLETIITESSPTGRGNPAAQHITLLEHFVSSLGAFTTEDHGVCAPAGGKSSSVCQLNDAIKIATGTGVFANASGELTAHGTLDLGQSKLAVELRGRICGDGLRQTTVPFAIQAGQPVSARVGPAGGVLRASQNGVTFTLRIPPAALDAETTISVAPVVSIGPLPFSGGVVAAAQFEPSGLSLRRPATLEITLPNGVSSAALLGFLIDDAGTRLEVMPAAVAGPTTTVITVPVSHFTVGGAANATLADFAAQVTPLLATLPPTLPLSQVASLMSLWTAWLERFGFDICQQTDLCQRVLNTATQSLALNQSQACAQAQSFLTAGEPFLAREALSGVVQIAGRLLEVRSLAQSAGVAGFDAALDLGCVSQDLHAIVDLAAQQALDHTSRGLLLLFLDVAGDGGLLGLEDLQRYAVNSLGLTLNALADRAAQSCLSDPAVGETLIDLVLGTFSDQVLDGIDPGLAFRFHDIRAGCRITITPSLPTVTVGHSVSFTATTVGLTPAGVTWSLTGSTLGSSIDATTGVFTADRSTGTVTVVATSQADPSRFKRTVVTIVEETCPVNPARVRRSSSANASGIAPSCVQVVVTPSTTTLVPGATQQFTASITGTSNLGVTWAATGGTITQQGLFTAGAVPGTYTVTATSAQDVTAHGQAAVVINADASSLAFTVLSAEASAGGVSVTNPTTTLPVQLVAQGTGANGSFTVSASGNQVSFSGSASSSGGEQAGGSVLLSFTTTKVTTFALVVNQSWVNAAAGSAAGSIRAEVQTSQGDAVASYSVLGGIVFDNRLSTTIQVAAGVTVQILLGGVVGSGATGAGTGATVTVNP